MKKPIPNSICDDCLNVECVWRAPSWGIDPPVMDCPNKKAPPITNYERLIRKTPEEMAAWIADHPVVSEYDENNPQHKAWLEWLRQEAET